MDAEQFLSSQSAEDFLGTKEESPKPTLVGMTKDFLGGLATKPEVAANLATNMFVGFPAGIVAGTAKAITSGLGEGIKTYKDVSNTLTYQPVTEAGQRELSQLGKATEFFTRPYSEGTASGLKALGAPESVQELGRIGTDIAIPAAFGLTYAKTRGGIKPKGKEVTEPIAPKEIVPKAEEFLSEIPKEEPPPISTTEIKPSLESLEAGVKGGSTQPLPKYAEGSAINLDRLETTNDVKQFINQQTKLNEERIGKQPVSWKETRKIAEELGWNASNMMKQTKKGRAYTAAEIDAMRQINMNMATDLHEKIKSLPADPAMVTPEMRIELLDTVNNYGEVLKTMSSASSEAGRALNIHKRMIANDPEFQVQSNLNRIMKGIVDKSGIKKLTDEMIADLGKTDLNDVAAVNKLINKYHKASIPSMFYEGWMNMLLSGPATHATNILSNALTAITKPLLETPATAVLELARGKKRGTFFHEVPAEIIGMWQGMKEGTQAALKAWDTGLASDMWAKTEMNYRTAIPGKFGEAVRIPTRALTAADEFFKSMIYRSELNRQAYSIAAKEGLKGNDRLPRMAELIENPTPEMLEKAHYEALYRTFNKPLGKMGNQLMGLRDAIPFEAGRYLVPFMRTPTNIAKFALERTPFNLAKIGYDLKLGKLTKEKLSEELAKVAVGSMIGATTMIMALEGHITGGGPKDKNKKEALYSQGWQPYSIKIGDTYYGFSRLEPLGSVMGMTADLAELMKDPYMEQQQKNSIVTKIASSVAKNLTSKTFIRGMSGAIDAMSDPARYGQNFLQQYTGTLIPNIVASTARATDPYYREVKTVSDTMASRVPGLSQTLKPKMDVTHGPAERGGNIATRFVSPIPVSKIKR